MSIPLNLITSTLASPSNSFLPSLASDLQPLFKSKRVRGPVPPSASIHPQKVELVCSYKPIAKAVQNSSGMRPIE